MKKLKMSTSPLLKEETSFVNHPKSSERQIGCPDCLVGDVLGTISPEYPGRALIRWRTLDGLLNERWLPTVSGLTLNQGDLVLLHRPGNWHEWLVSHCVVGGTESASQQETKVEVQVDKKRLELEAQDEIVLRCGKASITLRRNGRVVIRGAYLESRSDGTNRIKGGNVQIN